MRRLFLPIAILLAALAAVLPATAGAVSSSTIYTDCSHSSTGLLIGTYPKSALKKALDSMPTDISEYSGCYDAIKQALLGASAARAHSTTGSSGPNASSPTSGGSGGSSAGGGSAGAPTTSGGSTGGSAGGTSSTPANPSGALDSAGSAGTSAAAAAAAATPAQQHVGTNAPVKLAGAEISPGTLPAITRDGHALPTAVIVFLALLGAGGLAIAGSTLGRRVLARRRP